MRNTLLLASLLAVVIAPAAASAQPYDPGCVQSNQNNQAAGTVLGAIGGALLGGAIAGRHDRGAGVVVGGVGGAVAGNAIAGANNHPCPSGYYYAPPPPPSGFWAGAPGGIRARIDLLQNRIDQTAQGGWLSPREIDRLNDELNNIRGEDRRLHEQDGGPLRPEDLDYLQQRLDHVAQELHWMEHNH